MHQDLVWMEELVLKLETQITLFVNAHQIGKENIVKTHLVQLVNQLVIVVEPALTQMFVLILQDTIAISHLFAMQSNQPFTLQELLKWIELRINPNQQKTFFFSTFLWFLIPFSWFIYLFLYRIQEIFFFLKKKWFAENGDQILSRHFKLIYQTQTMKDKKNLEFHPLWAFHISKLTKKFETRSKFFFSKKKKILSCHRDS